MGLLGDVLQEIPTNAVLREKVSVVEAKYAAIETENAILKDDLRKAQAEIQQLKDEVSRLTPTFDPDETELNILTFLARRDKAISKHELADALQLHSTKIDYYLHKLKEQDYLHASYFSKGRHPEYGLSQKGREFVIKKGLL